MMCGRRSSKNEHTKRGHTGGYVILLSLIIASAVLIFLFVRVYFTPTPVISPDPQTSATSGQNRIEQMNTYKDDASRAKRQLEGSNNEIDKMLQE